MAANVRGGQATLPGGGQAYNSELSGISGTVNGAGGESEIKETRWVGGCKLAKIDR
jgi:hypothetical protein